MANLDAAQAEGQYLEGDAGLVKRAKTDRTKYKTEMCKNWVDRGWCRYNDKCQFAHGQAELVEKDCQNDKYKSRVCVSFN